MGEGRRPAEPLIWERAGGAIKRMKRRVLEIELSENQLRMKDASLNGQDMLKFQKREQELYKLLKEIEKAQLVKPAQS